MQKSTKPGVGGKTFKIKLRSNWFKNYTSPLVEGIPFYIQMSSNPFPVGTTINVNNGERELLVIKVYKKSFWRWLANHYGFKIKPLGTIKVIHLA